MWQCRGCQSKFGGSISSGFHHNKLTSAPSDICVKIPGTFINWFFSILSLMQSFFYFVLPIFFATSKGQRTKKKYSFGPFSN